MKYTVEHITEYLYSSPASLSQNEILLRPRLMQTQELLDFRVEVTPTPQHILEYTDYFGNTVNHFMVQHAHTDLTISSASTVITKPPVIPSSQETPPWEKVSSMLQAPVKQIEELQASQFLYGSQFAPLHTQALEFTRLSFPRDNQS